MPQTPKNKKVVMRHVGISLVYKFSLHDIDALTEEMELKIIQIENDDPDIQKVLTSRAHEVSFPLSQEDQDTIGKMQEILYRLGGVGLAAPQVRVVAGMVWIKSGEACSGGEDERNKG